LSVLSFAFSFGFWLVIDWFSPSARIRKNGLAHRSGAVCLFGATSFHFTVSGYAEPLRLFIEAAPPPELDVELHCLFLVARLVYQIPLSAVNAVFSDFQIFQRGSRLRRFPITDRP
jgi:hypothetical protein